MRTLVILRRILKTLTHIATAALVFAATACGATTPQGPVTGCDRYAAPDGRNVGPGTSDQPLGTVQALADRLQPGEVGCLRPGSYSAKRDDVYVLRLRRGGRAGAPITIRGSGEGKVLLRGIVEIPHGADHFTLSHVAVEGTGEMNAVKVYADDIRLDSDDITTAGRDGSCLILGSDSGGVASRFVLRRSYLHDCGSHDNGNKDHAIYAARLRGARIEQNLIVNPAAYAIQLYPDARRVRFARNVIDGGDSVRGGIIFAGDDESASRDNLVERNIVAYVATAGISSNFDGPVGVRNIARSNCVFEARLRPVDTRIGAVARSTLVADPGFRNRGDRDYRLDSDSPCAGVIGIDVAAQLMAAGVL